jgi:3-oxoacyl-[acyl-carrier protein] reductase
LKLTFAGQVVAVTGAGHGLGQAIAERFALLGARVFGCNPVAADVSGAEMAVVDLTDREAAAAWVREVESAAGQPIHVLVNNAGGVAGQVFKPLEEVTDADWDGIIAVNLGAAFAVTRAAVPGMKRAGRGRIINISSGAGLQPSLTGIQAYCSAKHAVIGFTRQMAHELGQFGITVNSVAPGLIPSNPASAAQWESYGDAKQQAMVQAIPMRRLGTPQEIANAVVFFASPLADFVSGQIIQVSGGR